MDPVMFGDDMGFAGAFLVIWLIVCLGSSVYGIAAYILQALGMYTIASRRQINHPWMAWVPLVNSYMLGCISDQYQYVAKGKNTSRRKVLLTLGIILCVLLLAVIVCYVLIVIEAISAAMGDYSEQRLLESMLAPLIVVVVAAMLMSILAIVQLVFQYIALYDLYASCEPKNAALFIVLSVVFNVSQPFFVFFSRKKDAGMPPRKSEYQPAMQPPAEPWEQTEE